VAHGYDPVGEKTAERATLTISELADRFMAEHVEQKRKPGTAAFYRHVLNKIKSELGATKADKVTRAAVAKLHSKLRRTPFQANRVLAAIGSMYAFAGRAGVVPEGVNPARRIEKFKEHRRERYLTGEELQTLGSAIREAETKGIPWDVDEARPKAKHLPKSRNRFTKIDPFAAAALRLLLFTGCRLREILHLKWENVDLERGLLFLPDSKSGRKTVILNAPAREIPRRPKAPVGSRLKACRIKWRSPSRSTSHVRELRCRWWSGPADYRQIARPYPGVNYCAICAPWR
jgi:integrase